MHPDGPPSLPWRLARQLGRTINRHIASIRTYDGTPPSPLLDRAFACTAAWRTARDLASN
jgi:hypothetical protein